MFWVSFNRMVTLNCSYSKFDRARCYIFIIWQVTLNKPWQNIIAVTHLNIVYPIDLPNCGKIGPAWFSVSLAHVYFGATRRAQFYRRLHRIWTMHWRHVWAIRSSWIYCPKDIVGSAGCEPSGSAFMVLLNP